MIVFFKKIYKIFIKKIFDFIYGSLSIASNDFFSNNVNEISCKFSLNSKKKYKIYEIENCRIYSDLSQNVAIIKKNYLLPKVSIQLKKNYLVEVNENEILNTGTRKLIQKKISGKVLSLVQGASAINNYGHWMMDIIPKICIAELHKDLNSYDAIYLPNFNKSFQIDSLKYFNLDFTKFINGSNIRHIFADKFIIPEHPYWEINKYQMETVANVDKEIVEVIRSKFLKNIKPNKFKKLFIDRSDSNFFHNQIENYDEVWDFLKKKNFLKLKLSNLSFEDQIKYFYNAEVIVGGHGAGLCNILFCNKGTLLVELANTINKCNMFRNISTINSMSHFKIESSKEPPKNRMNPDIYVDMNKLKSFLN